MRLVRVTIGYLVCCICLAGALMSQEGRLRGTFTAAPLGFGSGSGDAYSGTNPGPGIRLAGHGRVSPTIELGISVDGTGLGLEGGGGDLLDFGVLFEVRTVRERSSRGGYVAAGRIGIASQTLTSGVATSNRSGFTFGWSLGWRRYLSRRFALEATISSRWSKYGDFETGGQTAANTGASGILASFHLGLTYIERRESSLTH
ncbi:MAG TPA: hypothetical protein VNL98_03455 [Gemmatimonadales bacterium]|nr:hypothetical protein [Gemmatimonadales bacterium]